MVADPHIVLFCGGMSGSLVEETMADALIECALDTLDEALGSGAYGGALVIADARSAGLLSGRLPPGATLDVDLPGQPFHLGRRLTDAIIRHDLERPVYVGWGLPLIKGDEFAAVASALQNEAVVVSNNFFSADLVGFTPGRIVRDLDLPNNDRILPRLFVQQAGLTSQALPRTIANQFDLDTPGDLAVLVYAGGAGPHLRAHLENTPVDTARLDAAARLFTDNQAEVLVAGRVGSSVWQYLESETACRIRMYSEERGMQAAGRDLNGQARSLLAFHAKSVGPTIFFADLAEMVQAAFIDTRALFAHLGLNPSRADRFLSDAMQPDGITDPWIREFTAAACDAPIPVILGGSSLVTSGVQLLSEAAWRENDRLQREYRAAGRARRSMK